ncbi:MAG: response regulator [Candidatus Latescibacteria bacterium]|nr:response regulator [Candidatus Latescibacterota bacterium]NIO28378.1 response regulator [Candidatus Latescibacterota bacterium]NIO55927.1 response regulator [Candidatus Latescibacterota bacterium]NIT01891.1 response regulator [Candidatus Latescibacterota bacterium]
METILVIDDNSHFRKIAGGCLEEHGLTPVLAENGREALKIIEHRPPDAVLTDLDMPEMDGWRLVELMRRDYPSVPVVLMTDQGNEQAASAALKAGAASYVPKKDLRTNLCDAMSVVVAALEAKHHKVQVRSFLQQTEAHFILGYERNGPTALVSHLQGNLSRIELCDEAAIFQVSTALTEALNNAIDHGNLELDSELRERSKQAYAALREERMQHLPYRDQKVYVTERFTPPQATYVIRDEGPGFDHSALPNPKEPKNLLKASGRGVMLIRTFMDEVTFNDIGNEITMVKRCENSC